MAEIVNLRAKRKAVARKTARTTADENAARFGRTKTARKVEEAQALKSAHDLDGHKREKE